MRMVRNEIKKFFANTKKTLTILLLFLLSTTFLCISMMQTEMDLSTYRLTHEQIKEGTIDLKMIQEEIDKYEYYLNPNHIEELSNKYGIDWILEQNEKLESGISYDTIQYQLSTLKQLQKEVSTVLTYDDFKKQIEDQYKDYEQLPSFLKSETAGQRARKTYEAYENLTIAKSLTVQPSLGLESLLKSPIIILSTFLFLLYLLMNCIFVEREEHQLIYAASTINGKRKLYFSKYTALSFLTILFYVLQFVFAFLFSNIYFGHIDLSVPVQSLSFAQGCPYSINVFTFLVLYLVVVIISLCACSALAFVLCAHLKLMPLAIALIVIFISIEFMLFEFVSPLSKYSLLHYLNIWSYLMPLQLLANVEFISLFDLLIQNKVLFIFYLATSMIIFVSFSGFSYEAKMIEKRMNFISSRQVHSLVYFEMIKYWIKEKGILLVVVLGVIYGFCLNNQNNMSTWEDKVFNQFVDEIGATVNKKADKKILLQQQQYDEWNQELSIVQDITEQTYYSTLLSTQPVFEKYKAVYESRKQDNSSLPILKEDQYRFLYCDTNASILQVLFILFFVGYMTPSLHNKDKESKMIDLQKTTLNNQRKIKYFVNVVGVLLLIGLFTLLDLVYINVNYPNLEWAQSINALEMYADFPVSISIGAYFVISFLTKIFLYMFTVLNFTRICEWINKRTESILIFEIIFTLPVLIFYSTRFSAFTLIYELYHPAYWTIAHILFLLIMISTSVYFVFKKRRG